MKGIQAKISRKKRGQKGLGRLYKRAKVNGKFKEIPATSKIPGNFYLEYWINCKRIKEALKNETGERITRLTAAKEVQKRIIAPFVAKNQKGKLLDLKAKIEDAETQEEIALEVNRDRLNFPNAWNLYLKSQCRPDSGEATLVNYERHYRKFAEWIDLNYPNIKYLENITHKIASEYATSITTAGLSNNTFNKKIGLLKLLYRILIKDKYIPKNVDNPFSEIERKKKLHTSKKKPLTVEQIRTLILNAKGDLALLFALGYFTGLRRGDCCTLRWEEIDLTRRVILRVPNKIKNRSDDPKIVKVGIGNELYNMIAGTPSNVRFGYLIPKFAELYNDTGKRHRITRMITNNFIKCCISTQAPGTGCHNKSNKRAVTEYGFHSLRYSYITHQAEAGTSQALIQDNVAHSNPRQTQIYVKKSDQAAVDVANKLNLLEVIPELHIKEKVIQAISDTTNEKLLKRILEILEGNTV